MSALVCDTEASCSNCRLLVPMVVPVLMVLVHCTTVPVLSDILESTVPLTCQCVTQRHHAAMFVQMVWALHITVRVH